MGFKSNPLRPIFLQCFDAVGWVTCPVRTHLSPQLALVTVLLVIERLLNPTIQSAMSAPRHNFQLWPLATNPGDATVPFI